MAFLISALVALPTFTSMVLAANLFVSHYSGTINTLTLTSSSSGTYTLTQNNSLSVGGQPSWITYDSTNRLIYAADETSYGSASLFVVSAAKTGQLTLGTKANAPLGAVANVLYGGGYIASVHYSTSTISTFKLPLTTSSSPLQTITLTMSGTGTIPSRQDAPHPHEVIVSPAGTHLIVPDLGADLIRIYSISNTTGLLTACPSFTEIGGSGPRHGAFYGTNLFYTANELSNTVHAFTVSYASTGCLTLTRTQVLTTMPNNATAPSGTKVGEIHVKDSFIYLSNRRDLSFSPDDSMASFSLNNAGEMKFLGIVDSGGTYPRTFAINKAGDLVAVGDQTTSNIAVLKRNATTGSLGTQVATLRVGTVGTPENDNGLSAVLWDE